MAIELKIPAVGESITEVMVGEWLKKEGDSVAQDEPLVVIETDKVNVEIPAPQAGTLTQILKQEGDDAEVGDVVGLLTAGEAAEAVSPAAAKTSSGEVAPAVPATDAEARVSPAARRALADAGLGASEVQGSGKGGTILKEDVAQHLQAGQSAGPSASPVAPSAASKPVAPAPVATGGPRQEERVKMTPLRRKVAERLVTSQQQAALLTTFNEVDMSAVKALRASYKESFEKKHGVKLGFMSFFVKAAIEALKAIPGVNAEIQGDHVVYRNYQDIGIAVGGGKGLVVPVLRNAERMSFAEVELAISDFATRARHNKLTLDELQGGTFTISNGGIYGSLLSTPIINPPQSGILGMHKIEDRPVAVDGQVVIRPMMYLALTYDHRLVDGREAVTFLVHLKNALEDPARILLEV